MESTNSFGRFLKQRRDLRTGASAKLIFSSSIHIYEYSTDFSAIIYSAMIFLLSWRKSSFQSLHFLLRLCFCFMEPTNPQHHKFSTAEGILVFETVFTLCTAHSNSVNFYLTHMQPLYYLKYLKTVLNRFTYDLPALFNTLNYLFK